MLDCLVTLALIAAGPTAAAAPAPAPAPSAAAAHETDSAKTDVRPDSSEGPRSNADGPPIEWPEDGLTVARPGYGLGVEGIQGGGGVQGQPAWSLTPKSWRSLLREDPELARLNRTQRLVAPGAVVLAIGATWLTVSSAMAIDGYYATSAIGSLGQWFAPAIMTVGGVAMVATGVRARRKLHAARRQLYIAPYASRTSGGATMQLKF